jgi:nitroimidazol reductase NimA-like FMN-containing flavoprotein (pyridoxamine 5'-phosphate oxidase superfamily)
MITNINKEECFKILNNNYIGHLAYIYKNSPFVVPITYYYDKKNITIIGYTGEGHKTKALRAHNLVALEVAEIQSVDDWKSILVQGTFEELVGPDAKYDLHKFSMGVKKLIHKKEKKELDFIPEFSGKTHPESIPIVYHLNIHEITGKERKSGRNLNYSTTKKNKKFDIL